MTLIKNKMKKRISFITNVAFFTVFVYISSLLPGFIKQFNSDISVVKTASADTPTGDSTGDSYGGDTGAMDGACDGSYNGDGEACGPF